MDFKADPNVQGAPNPSSPTYRFTSEEQRTLKQCSSESFYQRSLPIATVLSGAAFYAVKSGLVKGHSKYGPAPKMFFTATVGYFLGKISYQRKCAEKLMALPNSPIGAMLRQRRSGVQEGSISMDFSPAMGVPSIQSAEVYKDQSTMNSALDIDAYNPPTDFDGYTGNNYNSGPSNSSDEDLQDVIPSEKPTSYEELRRKNREEYMLSRNPRPVPNENDAPSVGRSSLSPPTATRGPLQDKTKYGDVWG